MGRKAKKQEKKILVLVNEFRKNLKEKINIIFFNIFKAFFYNKSGIIIVLLLLLFIIRSYSL